MTDSLTRAYCGEGHPLFEGVAPAHELACRCGEFAPTWSDLAADCDLEVVIVGTSVYVVSA